MVRGVALGIGCTWIIGHTGIEAVLIPANFGVLAFSIRATSHWSTFNLWISSEAFWTVTDWLVVGDIALSIDSTITGIHTVSVVTGS